MSELDEQNVSLNSCSSVLRLGVTDKYLILCILNLFKAKQVLWGSRSVHTAEDANRGKGKVLFLRHQRQFKVVEGRTICIRHGMRQ